MKAGLRIEVISYDSDLVQLRVVASNGAFRGETFVYENHHSTSDLAEALARFPGSTTDTREYELGTFDPSYAGGGVCLAYSTIDRSGHCLVNVTMRTDPRLDSSGEAIARFGIRVEPAAIDSFVSSLSAMGLELAAEAYMPGLVAG